MKHMITQTLIIFVFALCLAMPQGAAASNCHAAGESSDKSNHGHDGQLIREATVNGYALTYRLIDMKARMKGMKDMPEMEATHHLMLFIKAPDGQPLEKSKVGFLVRGPADETQTVMAMAMSGGFGADIDLSEKGAYTIKAKAVAGEVKLVDEFTHSVK